MKLNQHNTKQSLRRLWLKKGEDGDTIVEVLITTAIISLILAGAYVTTNSSLLDVRSAKERSEALSIGQSQIESLRAVSELADPGYCFASGAPSKGACNFGSGGQPCSVGVQASYCYHVVDSLDSTSTDTSSVGNITFDTYKVLITWPNVDNNQTNSVSLYYNMNTQSGAAVAAGGPNAGVGQTPCVGAACVDVSSCPSPPEPLIDGCYYFVANFNNLSNDTPSSILDCSWTFTFDSRSYSTGFQTNDCNKDGKQDTMDFDYANTAYNLLTPAQRSTYSTEPYQESNCNDNDMSATLVERLTNLQTATYTYNTLPDGTPTTMPYCGS